MLFHTFIDLGKNELRNARFHNLASDPSSPIEGIHYWHTGNKKLRIYNGSGWDELGTGSGTVTSFSAGDLSPLFTTSEATVTTTPALTFTLTNAAQNAVFAGPASGGTGAPAYRALVQADLPSSVSLSYWAAPTGSLSMGSQKITNLTDGTALSDAATWGQVQGLLQGWSPKQFVTAATTANIATLAGGAPNTLDGISLAANDRVLVKDQSTPSQNGIYIVQTLGTGSNGTWVRANDADSWAEYVSAHLWVSQGTVAADTYWYCTVDAGGTLGTTAISFIQVNGASQITAGAGMTKTGNTLNVVSGNSAIVANADDITLTLATASGLQISSGLKILPDTTTSNTIGLTLTANGAGFIFNTTSFTDSGSETLALAATVAGNALTLTSGVLDVAVDNTTIEINTDALRVKAAGINHNHISSSSLAASLSGGSGTTLSVTGYTYISGTTVARKYVTSITLATGAYSQTVTHNLNTRDVMAYVYDSATFEWVGANITHTTVNTVTVAGTNNSGSSVSAQCVVIG